MVVMQRVCRVIRVPIRGQRVVKVPLTCGDPGVLGDPGELLGTRVFFSSITRRRRISTDMRFHPERRITRNTYLNRFFTHLLTRRRPTRGPGNEPARVGWTS